MNVPQGNRALCFREAMAHVCSPRLPDAPIWIVCTVDGDDHKIVTGSVDEVEHRESNPLTLPPACIRYARTDVSALGRRAMYVLVDDGRVSIHDVDNLKDFHVEVSADISEAELDELLRLQGLRIRQRW